MDDDRLDLLKKTRTWKFFLNAGKSSVLKLPAFICVRMDEGNPVGKVTSEIEFSGDA